MLKFIQQTCIFCTKSHKMNTFLKHIMLSEAFKSHTQFHKVKPSYTITNLATEITRPNVDTAKTDPEMKNNPYNLNADMSNI